MVKKKPKNDRKLLTPKIEVKRWVNEEGYEYPHPRTGTPVKVGRYRKKMKVYPNEYETYIKDDKGVYRKAIAHKIKKNGKSIILYRFVEDQRKAKLVPLKKAEDHFKDLPRGQQVADRRYTAKNQLEIIEKDGKEFVKESYLTKTGTSRYDIKGIDTKIEEWTEDWEKAKNIQEEYEKAKLKRILTEQEKNEAEKRLLKSYKKFFKKDDVSDKEEDLVIELANEEGLVIMDNYRISMLTTPKMFEGSRIDRITKVDKTNFKEIPTKFAVFSSGDRFIYDDDYASYWDLDKIDLVAKRMDKDTLEIYYGKGEEDGTSPLIVRDKDLVYVLAPRINENEDIADIEFDIKDLEYSIEREVAHKNGINERLKEAKEPELINYYQNSLRDSNLSINEQEFELKKLQSKLEDIKSGKKKREPISDIIINQKQYDKLKKMTKEELIILGDFVDEDGKILDKISKDKNDKGKLIYHVLERQKNDKEYQARKDIVKNNLALKGSISGLWKGFEGGGFLPKGIMDKERISLITKNEDFEKSKQNEVVKETYREIDYKKGFLDNLNSDTPLFITPDRRGCYKYDLVVDAMKDFEDPKLYYNNDNLLLIKGKNRSMLIAPRIEEDEGLYDGLPMKDYERLNKLTKKELAKKVDPDIKKIKGSKDGWIWEVYKMEKEEKKEKTEFPKTKIMEDESVYTFKKQFNSKDEAWKLAKEIGYARVEKLGNDYAVYVHEAKKKKQKPEIQSKPKSKSKEIKEFRVKWEQITNKHKGMTSQDQADLNRLILENPEIYNEFIKSKQVHRYYSLVRPISVGTVPDEDNIVKRENYGKLKKIPEENLSAHGHVDYRKPLSYKEMDQYDLVPEDDVEWANYMFWQKLDKNQKEANEIKKQYLELPLEELKANSERDPFCKYAYLIKKGSNDSKQKQASPTKPKTEQTKKPDYDTYKKKTNIIYHQREEDLKREKERLYNQLNKEAQSYSDNVYDQLKKLEANIEKATSPKQKVEASQKYYNFSEKVAKRSGNEIPPHLTPRMETIHRTSNKPEKAQMVSNQRKLLYERHEKEINDKIVKKYKSEIEDLKKKHNIPEEKKGAYIPEGIMMR